MGELTEIKQFNYLHKYTQILKKVINIDEKVHLIRIHGNMCGMKEAWNLYPWRPNMPCPFTTYSKDAQARQITACRTHKKSYEDKASFLAHWYLFHTIKDPYNALCQLVTMNAYGKKVQFERNDSKEWFFKTL